MATIQLESERTNVIRKGRKLSDTEKEMLRKWFDDAAAWAKSVGLKQEDIPQIIKEVRADMNAKTELKEQFA